MADSSTHHATVEVPADHGAHGESPQMINISGSLMVFTYITFALTAFVLYKAAWKPILAALDKREQDIRKAVEDAEKVRTELENLEASRARIITEADNQARDIVDKARAAAAEAARAIEEKAREEAQILLDNARREIQTEQDKARAQLRRESAGLAIDISRRILKDNLDEARSRKLADSLISQI